MRRIQHFIDGQHRAGTSGRSSDVYNPATGQIQAQVDLASAAEVGEAVAAALKASEEWSESSLTQRTQIMFRFRELLAERTDELARVISSEHGKVVSDAAGEHGVTNDTVANDNMTSVSFRRLLGSDWQNRMKKSPPPPPPTGVEVVRFARVRSNAPAPRRLQG